MIAGLFSIMSRTIVKTANVNYVETATAFVTIVKLNRSRMEIKKCKTCHKPDNDINDCGECFDCYCKSVLRYFAVI